LKLNRNARKSVVMAVGAVAALVCTASAQDEHEQLHRSSVYSAAAICGDYSAIAIYGANIARALGHETFDGKGKLTGAALANQPGPNQTRTLTSIGINGTYSVNADGSGKEQLTITLPGGATADVTEDFVITRTKMIDGVLIATEFEDMQETPSAVIDDSSLVIHSYSLRSVPKSCTSR